MKKLLILMSILVAPQLSTAQIGDVRQDGRNLHIYNDNFKNYKSLWLCKSCELVGFNSKYIVISEPRIQAHIYDHNGANIGFIKYGRTTYVKNVTPVAIIMSDGVTTWLKKFSDFHSGLYQAKTFK